MIPLRFVLFALAAATALGAAPVSATAATKAAIELPTLRTTATIAGRTVSTELTLAPLRRTDFDVLARPSAASVTLGWPATTRSRTGRILSRPCERLTYRLATVAADTTQSPEQLTASVLPTAQEKGTHSSSVRGGTLDGAWRALTNIENSDTLVVSGLAVRQLSTGDASARLTLNARSFGSSSSCAGASSFRLAPGATSVLQLAS